MATATASKSSTATPEPARRFVRFDLHQRLQHGMIMGSFILCMLTGWPLKMAGVGSSQRVVELFGDLQTAGVVHRVAAVLMILGCIYHVGYLFVRWRRKNLELGLVPGAKDLSDLVQNLRFFVGLRPQPPKFGRWSYFEKFDYWAVFWGVVIMAGSGLLMWFPEFFMGFMPAWTLSIAEIAHSDEALLAGLAIFIWHFYNVHLRRSVFPMSWVWLTGKLTEEEMRHDHPLEYERIVGQAEAPTGAADGAAEGKDEPH
jgi:formate dehydrogenase subunit gamma